MANLRKDYRVGAFEVNWQSSPNSILHQIKENCSVFRADFPAGYAIWRLWRGPEGVAPLVLIHGGWGSWTHWIKVIPNLTLSRSVLAVDLPGMGESSDISINNGLADLSEIIADNIEKIVQGQKIYDLVGFSFGAIVASEVAVLHGPLCRTLIAVGAAGFGSLHSIVEGIKIPHASYPSKKKDIIHKKNLSLLMLSDEQKIDDLAIYVHRKNIERGRFRSRKISLSSKFVENLPKIRAQIGGIWGALDSTGGGESNIEERKRVMRQFHPRCLFDVIKGGGHWIMYEKPTEFILSLENQLGSQN